MPIYRLRRIADDTVFPDEDARDDEHALAVFGQRLGVTLTFQEGAAAPEYMMGRIAKEPHWAKPEDVPVYELGKAST